MNRHGIFGSTFNPPHLGHLILIQEARWRLGLDSVIAVPTGDPYHKDTPDLLGADIRLKLAEAAFGDQPGIEVSGIEIGREGPSFTRDTLAEISLTRPGCELVLLLGADAALGIGSWQEPEHLFELARIAVAPRAQTDRAVVEWAVAEAGGSGRLEFFEMPEIGISSTLIRERIRAGAPYRHLVSTAAALIIDNEGLYGS